MRVAVYLGDLSPTAAGGYTFQDDVLKELLSLAREFQHSYVLLSRSPPSDLGDLDPSLFSFERAPSERSVQLSRIVSMMVPGWEVVARYLGMKTRLDRRLRRHRIDTVWFVTPFFAPTDLPYVYTVWDLQHRLQPWFPEVRERGRWLYREYWYAQAVHRARLIITPNAAGKEELQRFYGVPSSRIRLLKHPTPEFALRSYQHRNDEALKKYQLSSSFLLYPAQFWPHKNHVGLLNALSVLSSRHRLTPDLVLVGPDRGNLEHVKAVTSSLGLVNRVRILGFVDRADLVEFYRNAVLLPYVSFFGPENLPPLEAFALGCPVVAARADGVEEQLGDAAILVNPADPDDIADGIARVMKDPALRERMITSGRKRAAAWTAKDYVRSVLEEIDEFSSVRACWPHQ